MARIFQKRTNRPLPKDATIVTHGGKKIARWHDQEGHEREAVITTNKRGESRIVVKSEVYFAEFRDETGRLVTKSTGCKNAAGAHRELFDFEDEVERRSRGVVTKEEEEVAKRSKTAISDVVNAYIEYLGDHPHRSRAPVYVDHARSALRQFIQNQRLRCIGDLSRRAVESWVASRRKGGAAKKTLRNLAGHVKSFGQWAAEHEYLKDSPLRHMTLPSGEVEFEIRPISLDELEKLRESAPRERWVFYGFLAATGIRKGEALGLRVRDVTFGEEACVTIPSSIAKARREQSVSLLGEMAELLADYLRARGRSSLDAPLFEMPKKMNVVFKRDVVRAGITHELDALTLHSFRKFFCTELAKAGVPATMLITLARHQDFATTKKHYIKLDLKDQKEPLSRLPSFLSSSPYKTASATTDGASAVAAKVAVPADPDRPSVTGIDKEKDEAESAQGPHTRSSFGDSRRSARGMAQRGLEWAVEDSNL